MTKEKLVQFVEYLRKKEHVYIDDKEVRVGLRCRRTINTRDKAADIVKSIKKAKTTDEAVKKLSMHLGYQNTLWTLRPDILFREDLEEYMKSLGYSNSQVDVFLGVILNGPTKWKFMGETPYQNLFKGDEDMRSWAYALKQIPRRTEIVAYLPTEYDNFCKNEVFDCKALGLKGGSISKMPIRMIYYNIEYRDDSNDENQGKDRLLTPCFILVLPNYFQDEYLLKKTVRNWFTSDGIRFGQTKGNDVVIGRYVFRSMTKDDLTFDCNSLCIASNTVTIFSFKKFANHVMSDLNIKNAYLKDGLGQELYWVTISHLDDEALAKKEEKEMNEWFEIEDKAEELYPKVEEWAKNKYSVEYQDVQRKFGCSQEVAIELCRLLYDNNVTDLKGNIRELKTCAMCGKQFDFWDYNESVHLWHAFGFGSKYDTYKIDVWLCADCADKLMDIALPLFKEDPLEHYEDLPPATYTEEDAKEIEEYIKSHTKSDDTVLEDFDARYDAQFGDDSQQSLTIDEFKDKMQKIIDFK